MFVGGGLNKVDPSKVFRPQASLVVGWLNQCESPSKAKVDDFISGYGMSGASGNRSLGGGLSYSQGQGTATEFAIGLGGGMSLGELAFPDGRLGGRW